jgi:hypothetical protein
MQSEPRQKHELKTGDDSAVLHTSDASQNLVVLVEAPEVAECSERPDSSASSQPSNAAEPAPVPLPEAVSFRSRSLIAAQKLRSGETQSLPSSHVASSAPYFFKPHCTPGVILGAVLTLIATLVGSARILINPVDVPESRAVIVYIVLAGLYITILGGLSLYWTSCVYRVTGLFKYDSPAKKRIHRLTYGFYALTMSPAVVIVAAPVVFAFYALLNFVPAKYWLGGLVLRGFGLLAPLLLLAGPFITYRFMRRAFDHFQGDAIGILKKRLLSFLVSSTSWVTPLIFGVSGFILQNMSDSTRYGTSISASANTCQSILVLVFGILFSAVHMIPFLVLKECLHTSHDRFKSKTK